MSTNIRWDLPKDPQDEAWYGIPFPYVLDTTATVSVTIIRTGPVDFSKMGKWITPGDLVADAVDVIASSVQIGTDNKTVMMWLTDGVPRHEYAIQAHVTDADGNKLSRTAILEVFGQ